MIDLRSDTITRPVSGMLDAMMQAEIGDDVFGEDPTVNDLEEKIAKIFGKDSAVFCPSGTMTNQIALQVLTSPYEEVICYEGSHVYKYEGGGLAGNSGLSTKLLKGERGRLSLKEISTAINPDDPHFPKSSVISLENTVNKGGGSFYDLKDIHAIHDFARHHDLKMHLDGARIFNALVETGDDPRDYGKCFDTISVCLSKGLGAPVGSVLLCDKTLEKSVRRARKVFGGGMRQAGFLAAAGIYALDNHVDRLVEDHVRARHLGAKLIDRPWVKNVYPVDTNIVIFEVDEEFTAIEVLNILAEKGIQGVVFGPREIRWVTHLDYTDDMMNKTIDIINSLDL